MFVTVTFVLCPLLIYLFLPFVFPGNLIYVCFERVWKGLAEMCLLMFHILV